VAYASTITVHEIGSGEFVVEINETGAGPADEAVIDGFPLKGAVLRQETILISGSAATVDPILGKDSDPGSTANPDRVIVENDTPNALVDTAGVAPYYDVTPSPNPSSLGRVYHRSRPDAGADNAIFARYHVRVQW